MKIGASRSLTMVPAWDGEDRAYSGFVEAADEFGLGRVFWDQFVLRHPSQWDGLVAREGV